MNERLAETSDLKAELVRSLGYRTHEHIVQHLISLCRAVVSDIRHFPLEV